MKNMFKKENFISREFDSKQKSQSLTISILLIIFFIITAFSFFNMLYSFVDDIGAIVSGSMDVAIKDLLRNLPIFLVFFMNMWSLLLLHGFYRNEPSRLMKSIKKDSICLIGFASVNIIYIIIGLITGKYLSIIEGSPSRIFPLDTIIYSVLFIVLGVIGLLYHKKICKDLPYEVPSRGPIVTKARFVYCLFITFWTLFALYGLSGGLLSIFIYDFAHEYVFYGIATIIAYLLTPIFLCVWEFYYNDLTLEAKKANLLPLSLCGLCLSIVGAVLYFVSLSSGMDAPSNAGFGMFPIAFAASVNIATMLQVAVPLIVSIVALIKGILIRRK